MSIKVITLLIIALAAGALLNTNPGNRGRNYLSVKRAVNSGRTRRG